MLRNAWLSRFAAFFQQKQRDNICLGFDCCRLKLPRKTAPAIFTPGQFIQFLLTQRLVKLLGHLVLHPVKNPDGQFVLGGGGWQKGPAVGYFP